MSPAAPRRLLLIDDEDDRRDLFSAHLRGVGCAVEVEAAESGPQAIACFEACLRGERPWPWLVFLDVRMPAIGGFEVLDWTRTHQVLEHTAVVMMTNSEAPADIARARQCGARAYITKGTGRDLLRQLVTAACAATGREELLGVLSRYWPAPPS